MEKKIRNTLLFAGSLIVALMFISSLFSSSSAPNFNIPIGGSTPTQKPTTYLVSGGVNAIVLGYGSVALVNVTDANVVNSTGSILLNMEDNGTIDAYNQVNNQFRVDLSTITVSGLKALLNSSLGSNSFNLAAVQYLRLPSVASLAYSGSQKVPVYLGSGNYSVETGNLIPANSTVPISILAFVYLKNGTYEVYNNSLRLSVR